jgi:hypothetical protein
MKQLSCLAIVILLVAGCAKKLVQVGPGGLAGKWKLTERFWSTGAPGGWYPDTSPIPVIIEFTNAGDFNYTSNFPKASLMLNRYTLSGDTVTMSSTTNSNIDTWTYSSPGYGEAGYFHLCMF